MLRPPVSDPIRAVRASASSTWSDEFAPAKAIDGNQSTRWNSAKDQIAGAWLALEFAQPVRLDVLLIDQEVQWTRITAYALEEPDGEGWKPVFTGKDMPDSAVCRFPAVTVPRIRIRIDRTSGATPSLCEVRAYDTTAAAR